MRAERVADVPTALATAGAWLRETQNLEPIAVGHRVVHGGPQYDRPVLIDPKVLAELERYVSLAPLHQPNNLAPIRSILARSPGPPPGRLLRHRISSWPRRAGGPLRDPGALLRGRRAPLRVPRPVVRIRREPPAAGGARGCDWSGDRRPSRQRRLDVRALGRPQRREHDGLYRTRRVADGDPAGPDRSRRRAVSHRGEGR